jgi:hyperosmotically inducible periplasmic protein
MGRGLATRKINSALQKGNLSRGNMQQVIIFLILIIFSFSGFLTEVSAQYGNEKPVEEEVKVAEKVENKDIEQQVFKQILRLPYYGVFDSIGFQVDGHKVILNGKVARSRNRKDAEYAIKRIAGVDEVVNNIEVLPLSSFDNSIRIRLLRTYNRSAGLFRYLQEPNPSVRLIVDRGHITLVGYVANRGDYNLMNILANGVSDVFSVKNNLIIEKE